VLLVDANTDGAIEEITEKGIRAGGKEYEFDIILRDAKSTGSSGW
jgi:hypothetical protein